ncbi:MAG: CDP-diacylglycerol--glycerol-3-phosphate 3-phosphatidyltransferase [Phycisphaerae bacterium]|nr:CDP-diacylglycerol--glycerol-3-phosphate 3-phosphatidyltransferase [Phycisphaerae bacterium]
MKARLPNLITSVRFVLALFFFGFMEAYHHGDSGSARILDIAFALFFITAVTDVLDGYLARKWNQESTFGRIVDPLVDKVLVIGAFIYLASSHFAVVSADGLRNASGVAVWMVALVLVRELVVTGLRGFSESQGLDFKATIPGKLKMFFQCMAAGAAMLVTNHMSDMTWALWLRSGLLWAMVIITFFSMLVYLERARTLFTMALKGKAGEKGNP